MGNFALRVLGILVYIPLACVSIAISAVIALAFPIAVLFAGDERAYELSHFAVLAAWTATFSVLAIGPNRHHSHCASA